MVARYLRYGLKPTPQGYDGTTHNGPNRQAGGLANYPRLVRRLLGPTLLVGMLVLALLVLAPLASSPAVAQESPPTTVPTGVPSEDGGQTDTGGEAPPGPPATLPLVPVPVGCAAPPLPQVVFVGQVRNSDRRSVEFKIESVRSGTPVPFASDDRITVRYGLDAQYLRDGERYLVSAPIDPDLGVLVSRVTPVTQNFGGDEVIGVSESDIKCPIFEDPMRTLHLDGTPIGASVVQPLFGSRMRLLTAIAIPIGLVFAGVFLLATLRLSVAGVYRSVTRD